MATLTQKIATIRSAFNVSTVPFAAQVIAWFAAHPGIIVQSVAYKRPDSTYTADEEVLRVAYLEASGSAIGGTWEATLYQTVGAITAQDAFNTAYATPGAADIIPIFMLDITDHERSRTGPESLLVIGIRTDVGPLGEVGYDRAVYIANPINDILAGAVGNALLLDASGATVSLSIPITNVGDQTWVQNQRNYVVYDELEGVYIGIPTCCGASVWSPPASTTTTAFPCPASFPAENPTTTFPPTTAPPPCCRWEFAAEYDCIAETWSVVLTSSTPGVTCESDSIWFITVDPCAFTRIMYTSGAACATEPDPGEPYDGAAPPGCCPGWTDTIPEGDVDTEVNNADSSYERWVAIELTAGTVSKLRIFSTTNTFGASISMGLYDSGGNLLSSGGIPYGTSVLGFNEVNITPVVIPHGNYFIAFGSLANADMGWGAKAGGGTTFATSLGFFNIPTATLPVPDFTHPDLVLVGAFITP